MAVRGVKGDGYFVKIKNGYEFRQPYSVYDNGRTKYKSFSAKTKKEAKAKAALYFNKLEADAEPSKGEMLVSDYMLWWLKNCKKDSKEVRPQTLSRMFAVVQCQIIPCIGQRKLNELTKGIIQTEMVNRLIVEINPRTGKGLSESTIHKAITHLKNALNEAVDNGYISSNPCANVKLPKSIKEDAQKKKTEKRFFSDDEITRFIEVATAENSKGDYVSSNGPALVLAMFTGMRIGEVLGLKRGDVDLKKRLIHVSGNRVEFYDMDTESETYRKNVSINAAKTKTSSGMRNVPIPEAVYNLLVRMCRKCQSPKDNLLTGEPNRAIRYHNILRTYKAVCSHARIENPEGLHTLRHTCASLLFRANVDVKLISEILGHSSVQFTLDVYTHLCEESLAMAANKLSNAWSFVDPNKQLVRKDTKDTEITVKESCDEETKITYENVVDFLKNADAETLIRLKMIGTKKDS